MSPRRRFAFLIAALVGVPLAAAVAAFLFGVSIDASHWRDGAAQRAAAALGRPVMLSGVFELRLGREPGLRIGNVQVLNPPGFTGPQFLTINELRARFDLLDALRGRLRLRHIEAGDVDLWLERAADGRGNWSSTVQRDPTATQARIDVDRLSLLSTRIHYHDARTSMRRIIELDELSGSAGRDAPLHLAARGRVERRLPSFSLRLEGGPLRQLQPAAGPWPFTLDLKTQGARLHAEGSLHADRRTAGFRFDAHADDPAPIERLLGAKLPLLGRAALRGTLSAEADFIRVSELHGWLGESELSGQLALALGGARPRLSGALSAAVLDLRPWLAGQPDALEMLPDGDAATRQTLPLRNLSDVDIELDLRVGRWLGPRIGVRDTSFALRADRQGLRIPMSATLAGIPVSGRLELDTVAPIPAFDLQLSANHVVLDGLAQDLGHASGIEGTIGRLALRLVGRGETLEGLARDLELSFAAAAAQLRFANASGGRAIAVSLDTLELAMRRGHRLRGQARGMLLGERANLTVRGGTLADMLREKAMPLKLELSLAQARLRVEGAVPFDGSMRGTALRFDLQARRAGDLARWLRVAPTADLAVALRGQWRMADEGWMLDPTTLQLGRSALTIAARRTLTDGRPIVMASVRSPLIDVPQLATLRAGDGPSRSGAPIFPAAFDLMDAHVDVGVQHLLLGRADLADVAFVARSRDARLLPASVTGKVAGAPFKASVELDLHGELPMASLDLSTGAVDLGVLLRRLGVAEDIDGRAQAVHLKLLGRGNTLHELADHSALDVRVQGGSITVLGAAQRPVADIRIDEARIGVLAGEPVRLRLDGALDQKPVRIDVRSGTLGDFVRDANRVPFALAAQAAGARLTLDGEVTLPLGSGGQLIFGMSGDRLDTLSELARVELPAWGPWSFRAPIRMTPTGYDLQDLDVAVGRSRLRGSGKLDLSGPRPYLEVQVASPSIQIDDFPRPQRLTESPGQPGDGWGGRAGASRFAGRTDTLLSAAFLRRLDATLDLKAKEVLSGADRLADGALHLRLRNGRLDLDPAVVNLPGGALRLTISYDLKGSEVEFGAAAYVERFDYGIIARRLKRADDLRGLFSLNLEIAGTAPSLEAVMRNASGRMDFAVWPTELRSGIFNLWSANLVLQLLPLIDPGAKPQVNCIVGRFDLDDGDLADDKILIDTSTVRIRGTGNANLATEKLAFVFRPRAKGIGLLRLQTPLRVDGTLTDPRFYFTQADVLESVLRLIASPVLLPIEWLTKGPMQRDGADVCTDPLRAFTP